MENRNIAISWVRACAMIMIVLCHYLQFYQNRYAFFFNVGVQVFFLISGFLYGAKDVDFSVDWFNKRFKKISVSYYIFIFIVAILYFWITPESINGNTLFKATLFCGTIKGIEHLWFIPYILFCYIITPYLNAFKKTTWSWSKKVVMGGAFLVSFQFVTVLMPLHFHAYEIDCYIIGYILANLANNEGLKIIRNTSLISIPIAVIMNAFRLYEHSLAANDRLLDGEALSLYDGYSHMMMGVAIFTFLLFLCRYLRDNNILHFSDKYSYQIYIVHHLFLLSPLSFLALPFNPIINIALSLMAILISAVSLEKISNLKLLDLSRNNNING